jgi:hypothetical protein
MFVVLENTFTMGYHAPKPEVVCKSYDLGKLRYQLTLRDPHNLVFHLLGLGFWMSMVLEFTSNVKKASGASL